MTDITHQEVRDLLPDLLHERLSAPEKSAIESHLEGCAGCRAELNVLRMVQAAPAFGPRIDAARIASAIPPYAMRGYQAPVATTKVRSRVFVTLAAAVVIVGSVLVVRGREGTPVTAVPPATIAAAPQAPNVVRRAPAPVTVAPAPKVPTAVVAAAKPRELQLAAGLEGLSDGGVQQLLRELYSFDGLPSAEPEPVGLGDQGSGGALR
jgi:hypothetical protein